VPESPHASFFPTTLERDRFREIDRSRRQRGALLDQAPPLSGDEDAAGRRRLATRTWRRVRRPVRSVSRLPILRCGAH